MVDVGILTRGLSGTRFRIREVAMDILDGANGVEFSLDPGSYHFDWNESSTAAFPFAITADGLIDFDEALGGFLKGRGTRELVVQGFDVTIDGTRLAHHLFPRHFGGGEMRRETTHLRFLLPATGYGLQAGSGGGLISPLSFDVTVDGRLVVGTEHTRYAHADGRTLVLDGFEITVDGTDLSHDVFPLNFDAGFLSHETRNPLRLLPCPGHGFQSGSGVVAALSYEVTTEGEVVVGPEHAGYADGSGSLLRLRGVTITIDGRDLPYDLDLNGAAGIGPLTRDRVHTLVVLPADYGLESSGAPVTGMENNVSPAVAPLTAAAGLDAQGGLVVGATEGLRSAALNGLGVREPRLVDVVGQLDEADRAVVAAGVTEIAESAGPATDPSPLPGVTPLPAETPTTVVTALEPVAAYERMLAYAHDEVSEEVTRRPLSQFHPVMAAPLFPEPLAERLTALDKAWVLGGVGALPANSVCLLGVNWRFVEAFLAGANHEMARELLWRGYPTDLRGSCFRQFWRAPAPDVTSMDTWLGDLGSHGPGGPRRPLTMLVIKGDLLRRYPSTLVSAERGTTSAVTGTTGFTSDGLIAPELFRGSLGDEVTYVALDIDPKVLAAEVDRGNRLHSWYISLLQPHDEPRFGMDEAELRDDEQAVPNVAPDRLTDEQRNYDETDNWTWQGRRPDPAAPHLLPEHLFAGDSSAVVAASLFQRPFRLLLRAPDYLPVP